MRAIWLTTLISTVALVSGCAGTSTSPGTTAGGKPAVAAPLQRCNPAGTQWAIGKTNTAHHIEEARKRSGALMARVIRPGQPVTADANVERLNLQVDATNRIISASCG